MTEFDYYRAFDRMIGVVDEDELDHLRTSRIGIGGCGGTGGYYVLALARMGFEKFTLADDDTFELANLNRQAGAMMSTLGRPKVDVLAEMAADINPGVDVRRIPQGLNKDTAEEFFDEVDVVLDAIDYYAIHSKHMLYDGARERGIYALAGAAPIGFGVSLTTIGPETPSFTECFGLDPQASTEAQLERCAKVLTVAGLPHAYLKTDLTSGRRETEPGRVSTVSASIFLAAAVVATETFCIVTERRQPVLAPSMLQIDLYTHSMAVTRIPGVGVRKRAEVR